MHLHVFLGTEQCFQNSLPLIFPKSFYIQAAVCSKNYDVGDKWNDF